MRKIVLVAFITLVSSVVSAGELDTRPWLVLTAGGSLGVSNTNQELSNDVGNAFSIGMGWDFAEYLATEFNYTDLGKVTYKNSLPDMSSRTFTASLLPTYRFNNARVFGRIGLGRWTAETPGSSKTGVEPVAGVGFEYKLGRAATEWSLRAEWQHHFAVGDKGVTGQADIDTAMLGFTFRH